MVLFHGGLCDTYGTTVTAAYDPLGGVVGPLDRVLRVIVASGPDPAEFVACTVTLYAVPGVRPERLTDGDVTVPERANPLGPLAFHAYPVAPDTVDHFTTPEVSVVDPIARCTAPGAL